MNQGILVFREARLVYSATYSASGSKQPREEIRTEKPPSPRCETRYRGRLVHDRGLFEKLNRCLRLGTILSLTGEWRIVVEVAESLDVCQW